VETVSEQGLIQLLSPEGQRVTRGDYASSLNGDDVFKMYRDMVISRRIDSEATALQRQGELALWASLLGQEGAQVGAGWALRPNDFVFPSYREHAVAWCRGIPPSGMLRLFRAVSSGGWDPYEFNYSVPTIVLGSQVLHAVGYAMGIQRDGREDATMVFFGDGASSEGDTLEAFVWAASFNAPVVFFCQNNQFGISTPVTTQSRSPLYLRGPGFGFPGHRVDGNDPLAVYEVTKEALARARAGDGPTLIEAYTYRMGAHTTSDDPSRYRMGADVEKWRLRDPIERMKALLSREYGVAVDRFEEVREEAETVATELRSEILAMQATNPMEMFDHVYAHEHPRIDEGRRDLIELGLGKATS